MPGSTVSALLLTIASGKKDKYKKSKKDKKDKKKKKCSDSDSGDDLPECFS